jgi:beta-glucosidase
VRIGRRGFLAAGVGAAGLPLLGCRTGSEPARTPAVSSPAATAIEPGSSPTASQNGDRLPDGLLLGFATAAYQIEGAVAEDGRGLSIWDTFCRRPGVIDDHSSGAVACDHYHRWKSDVDLMARLNTQTYRFSVAWPRIMPDGRGRVNTKGLDFYRRLVDRLQAAAIVPMATVYHWDLPQALQDRGGWQNRDCAGWFADYAAVVFERLTGIDRWVTINEPRVIVNSGHRIGTMAPGIRSDVAAGRVIHHLALAHGQAVLAFRAAGSPGRIGWCCAASPCYPADDSAEAAAQAAIADTWHNTVFLDPVLRGRYPELTDRLAPGIVRGLDEVRRSGDLSIAQQPIDFIGLNYYSPTVVNKAGKQLVFYPTSASGQQLYPRAFYDLLARIHRDYRLPIIITETGIPDYAGRPPLADGFRIDFVRDHLRELLRAVIDGARVDGVHLWSLMDNWEWARGFTQRWGLVRVDYDTQARIPKQSAAWFAELARTRILAG